MQGSRVSTLTSFLALASSLAAIAPVEAQPIPLGAVQPVNQVTTGDDFAPSIGVGDAGDFVVAWERYGGDGSGSGLFGRAFPAAAPAEAEFAVNSFTTGSQTAVNLDMNGSRDFTVVWSSFNQASGSSNFDLIARQSSSNGTSLSGEFAAESVITGGSFPAAVASDAGDGFVVAWRRSGAAFARQFDSAGSATTVELTVTTSPFISNVDVGVDAERRFVVVWDDSDADQMGIYGRIYGADGASPGAIFPVNEFTTGSQFQPKVAMAANGEFVVVWADEDNVSSRVAIEGRRFARNGTPIGSEFLVSPADGNDHVAVDLDGHPDGSFVAIWQRQIPSTKFAGPETRATTDPTRIFSREYERTARPVDGPFEESAQPGDNQGSPTVGVSGNLWVAAWSASDADGAGIFSRSYLRRAIFADDFEGEEFHTVWSAAVP